MTEPVVLRADKPPPIRPATHERLRTVIEWWRKRQHETKGAVSDAYRQCANDLDLALDDDKRLR